MRFIYGKSDWKNPDRGIENGFLLTNGLGGFCAQTVTGANARGDQAVLMGCTEPPAKRISLVSRIEEEVWTEDGENGGKVSLSSQQYVDSVSYTHLRSMRRKSCTTWARRFRRTCTAW